MKTIWKFEFEDVNPHISMPVGAKILCVQVQGGKICVWAEVDPPEHAKEERVFMVVGTGHQINFTNGKYIGTVQTKNGLFVWHVYELI